MKFKQKSFRKIPDILAHLKGQFLLGIQIAQLSSVQIEKISDRSISDNGDSFLPNRVGRFSRVNADGKEVIRRDKPKETISREYYYTRYELHGRDRVEVEDSTWRTYERFPRDIIQPQEVHIKCIEIQNEKFLLIECDSNEDHSLYLHKLNLALELFGAELEVQIPAQDGFVQLPPKFKVVNWLILPSGTYTKEELREKIKTTISPKLRKTVKPIIEKRLNKIASYNHQEIAIGIGGYKGYVIYNFIDKGISVLESDSPNNATYVFNFSNWTELSKKTKSEIINGGLARRRIIHDQSWDMSIDQILR